MPTAPEFGDIGRHIGPVEIFGKAETEEQRQPDRHLRITGKVEVDLKGEGVGADPQVGARIGSRVRVHRVDEHRQVVGNHHFAEKAHCEELDALADRVGQSRRTTRCQLG